MKNLPSIYLCVFLLSCLYGSPQPHHHQIWFPSLQVNTTCVCSVVRIKSEVDVLLYFTTEPLNGTKLEFSVSTEDTGLKYNSKYNTTVEDRHGSERSKVQLSK